MYFDTYIKEVIRKVDLELAKSIWQLFKTARSTINPVYLPELDVSLVLEYDQANYYQTSVWHLIWAVELGRININL